MQATRVDTLTLTGTVFGEKVKFLSKHVVGVTCLYLRRICRVKDEDEVLRRVAVEFSEPLSFKPGEQGISESEAQRKLGAMVV